MEHLPLKLWGAGKQLWSLLTNGHTNTVIKTIALMKYYKPKVFNLWLKNFCGILKYSLNNSKTVLHSFAMVYQTNDEETMEMLKSLIYLLGWL